MLTSMPTIPNHHANQLPNNHVNNQVPRKSLSNQLDRFDNMLDGLDVALQGAITDAVKEATRTAVAEAVRATLLEVATNPDILKLLRAGVVAPTAAPQPAPTETVPAVPAKGLRGRLAEAWRRSVAKVKAGVSFLTAPVRGLVRGVSGTVSELNRIWKLRRPVLIALIVGVAAGVVGALAAPWLAGILSGVGAAGTAFVAQFIAWTRRLCSTLSIG